MSSRPEPGPTRGAVAVDRGVWLLGGVLGRGGRVRERARRAYGSARSGRADRALLLWIMVVLGGCHPASLPLRAPHVTDADIVAGSSIVALDVRTVAALDEDLGTLSIAAADTDGAAWSVRSAITVGRRPVALAVARDGRVLVVDRAASTLIAVRLEDGGTLRVVASAPVPEGPVALLVDHARQRVYVACAASAVIAIVDLVTLEVERTVPVSRSPGALAASRDGRTLFVLHLVGGRSSVIDADDATVGSVRVIDLPLGVRPASFEPVSAEMRVCRDRVGGYGGGRSCTRHPVELRPHARDRASVARAMTISPDGAQLYVAYTVVRTGREDGSTSTYGGGGGPGVPWPLDVVSVLDVDSQQWLPDRVEPAPDHLLARPIAPDPSAIAVRGDRLLIASLGADLVAEVALSTAAAQSDVAYEAIAREVAGCSGPSGIAFLSDDRVAVRCGFSHSVHILDRRAPGTAAVVSLGSDVLPADAAEGRRLFHRSDASDFGWSCASCHPEGGDDALTWSTPHGPRQTPSLVGRLDGTAPYGWTGAHAALSSSLGETQRRVLGRLGARQLAAIEAYLLRGLQAPSREPPAHDTGAQLFTAMGCAHCHRPSRSFTDGERHDFGAGAFDTPSLRSVGTTAPYFHDGRHPTLDALLQDAHGGSARLDVLANPEHRQLLVDFLRGL